MRYVLLLLLCLNGVALAGQLEGESYTGERFGRIQFVAPGHQWLMLDREFSGSNEFGGPVLDLKAVAPVGGFYPSLHVSAFKRADASVSATFVLQTSQDAVRQKGGLPAQAQIRAVNGKNIWFFEAEVMQQDKPARLYYLLLEGAQAYFALQTVVPAAALPELKQRIDELLLKVSY